MDSLKFLMGKHEAHFPLDRLYSTINHTWLLPLPEPVQAYRLGFTAYSVRLLRDVYFVDWALGAGTPVEAKQRIGEIESSKAVSDLYAPAAGTILAFNQRVLADPAIINTDGYGEGWLLELQSDEVFLDPHQYLTKLDLAWANAQRIIKKQHNES